MKLCMAKISVIVPVYNVEKYIHRCVDSILNQTFTDYELILVDDGSPDNCGKICDEYAEKDSRIHVIHKENGGLSDARNAGLDWMFANSDSEWITFIDSDDWVHPQYLEILLKACLKFNLNISSTRLKQVPDYISCFDLINCVATKEKIQDVYTLFNKTVASYACGRLYNKDCFNTIRFPKGKAYEDLFTIYKVFLKHDYIAFVSEELYFYFINPESISRKWSSSKFDIFEAYDCILTDLACQKNWSSVIPIVQKEYLKTLGWYYYRVNHTVLGEKEKSYYSEMITIESRKRLKKYKKSADISIKRYPEIYEAAYPSLMKYYWIIISQINKLTRKKNV